MSQICRHPENELTSPAMERDADSAGLLLVGRQRTTEIGVASHPRPVRARDDDVSAVVLRGEAVSKLKGIDPVIDGERYLQTPSSAKHDGLRFGIHQHRRWTLNRIGANLSVEE